MPFGVCCSTSSRTPAPATMTPTRGRRRLRTARRSAAGRCRRTPAVARGAGSRAGSSKACSTNRSVGLWCWSRQERVAERVKKTSGWASTGRIRPYRGAERCRCPGSPCSS